MGEKQSSSWAAHFAGIYLRDEIGAVRLEIVPCICFTKVVGFHPYSPLIGLNPVLPGLSLRWEKLHYSCHVSSFLLFLLLYPTLLPSPFRQAKFNTVPLCVQIFNKRFFFPVLLMIAPQTLMHFGTLNLLLDMKLHFHF